MFNEIADANTKKLITDSIRRRCEQNKISGNIEFFFEFKFDTFKLTAYAKNHINDKQGLKSTRERITE